MAGKLVFRVDANQVLKDLRALTVHEVPAAAARAVNRLTYGAFKKVQDEMGNVFDRPTRFTLSGFFFTKATSKSLSTTVATKDFKGSNSRVGFLGTQVRGGAREMKGFERALRHITQGQYVVPGKDCPLDNHGNISRSILGAVLRSLTDTSRSPSERNANRANRQARVKRSQTYFVESGRDGRPRGVFLPRPNGEVAEILRFIKQPHYKPRLDADAIVVATINRRYDRIIREEIDRAIRKRKSL